MSYVWPQQLKNDHLRPWYHISCSFTHARVEECIETGNIACWLKRLQATSCGDRLYYMYWWARLISCVVVGSGECDFMASFWGNISTILLELLQKMLRVTVQMRSDRYRVGFVYVAFDFSANATFNHYRSPPKRCLKTSERHQNEGWTWIRAYMYIRTNMIAPSFNFVN